MRFDQHKEYLVRGGPGISSMFSFFFGFPLKERGKIQKRISSNKKKNTVVFFCFSTSALE